MKRIPTIKMQLTSSHIGPVKADKEFRLAMQVITAWWNKHKNNPKLEIIPEFDACIKKIGKMQRFQLRKLKTKWTAEVDQNLQAFYQVGVTNLLRKALQNELAKKV
jgi:hypothetical protein